MQKKIIWILVLLLVGGLIVKTNLRNSSQADLRAKAETKGEVSSLTHLSSASNSDGSLVISGTSEIKLGKTNYKFVVSDNKNKTETLIFETVAEPGQTYTIPYNSWSSDYKHLYLQENTPEGTDYLVFNADGSSYKDGKNYLRVEEYWRNSKINQLIDHASGWAGPDLLVLYTTNMDGSGSNAYWYLISSRKFLQVRQL